MPHTVHTVHAVHTLLSFSDYINAPTTGFIVGRQPAVLANGAQAKWAGLIIVKMGFIVLFLTQIMHSFKITQRWLSLQVFIVGRQPACGNLRSFIAYNSNDSSLVLSPTTGIIALSLTTGMIALFLTTAMIGLHRLCAASPNTVMIRLHRLCAAIRLHTNAPTTESIVGRQPACGNLRSQIGFIVLSLTQRWLSLQRLWSNSGLQFWWSTFYNSDVPPLLTQ